MGEEITAIVVDDVVGGGVLGTGYAFGFRELLDYALQELLGGEAVALLNALLAQFKGCSDEDDGIYEFVHTGLEEDGTLYDDIALLTGAPCFEIGEDMRVHEGIDFCSMLRVGKEILCQMGFIEGTIGVDDIGANKVLKLMLQGSIGVEEMLGGTVAIIDGQRKMGLQQLGDITFAAANASGETVSSLRCHGIILFLHRPLLSYTEPRWVQGVLERHVREWNGV